MYLVVNICSLVEFGCEVPNLVPPFQTSSRLSNICKLVGFDMTTYYCFAWSKQQKQVIDKFSPKMEINNNMMEGSIIKVSITLPPRAWFPLIILVMGFLVLCTDESEYLSSPLSLNFFLFFFFFFFFFFWSVCVLYYFLDSPSPLSSHVFLRNNKFGVFFDCLYVCWLASLCK